MSYAAQAAEMGWDDLRDLAWQACYPVLNHLANNAISATGADPGESALALLQHYLDPAVMMGFTDIESRIRSAMDTLVRAVAAQGYEKCQQGQHTEGRAILNWAMELAMRGVVEDMAFQTQLTNWLNDCGSAQVTLFCDSSRLFDIAITDDDRSAVAIFEATVRSSGGVAMEGLEVWVQKYMPAEDRWRAFGGGTSDAEGKVKTFFIYGRAPESFEPDGTATFKAYAIVGEERIYSEIHLVELVRRRFSMEYDYTMSYL